MTIEGESAHALTGAYVLDALDADELVAFERHLAACPDCRDEVLSLRAAVVRLPSVSVVAPPPALRASVLAAISGVRPMPPLPEQITEPRPEQMPGDPTSMSAPDQAEQTDTSDPTLPAAVDLAAARTRRDGRPERGDRRVDRWRMVAAAAAVIALTSVGWNILTPDPVSRTAGAIEQGTESPMVELLSAPDLEIFAGEHGTVLRSATTASAAAILQDLPDLGDGLVFQAWTIAGETPVSAGVFQADGGRAATMLEGDVATADAVAVTIEPDGGSAAPTGDMVFQILVS